MNILQKVAHITIPGDCRLMSALQKMDQEGVKSLLILDGDKLVSLISIGDIQRAIIRNMGLECSVLEAARKEITVAREGEPEESIRRMMLQYRTEFMPVIREDHTLLHVYFWKDFFSGDKESGRIGAAIPVVVMAGGFGSRLKPLTNVIPKPLVPVGDKTILEVIMDKFCAVGLNDFYFTVNYKHEMIRFYMDTLPDPGYNIQYVLEQKPLGTAGSLSLLRGRIDTTFFVTNCDIIVDDDYSEIYNYHRAAGNKITIVASLKHMRIPYGTIESGEEGELISLKEKPELTFMINTGMYILEPGVLDDIPEDTFIHITDIIERIKAKGERVGVYPVSEKSWTDIGDWPEYSKVINRFI